MFSLQRLGKNLLCSLIFEEVNIQNMAVVGFGKLHYGIRLPALPDTLDDDRLAVGILLPLL